MVRLRVRWTKDPEELPGHGEALARLRHTWQRRERFPDGTSGIVRGGYKIIIEAHGGRRLVADVPPGDSDRAAPLIEADAPADLVDVLNRAWKQRQGAIGRPRGRTDLTAEQLRPTLAAMRRERARITRATLAARAGCTDAALRGYLHVYNLTMDDLRAGKLE